MTPEEVQEFNVKAQEFHEALFMSTALNFLMHNPTAFENMKDRHPWNQAEFQNINWYKLKGWEFTETGVQLIMSE